jgi:hypothetical protein
VLIVVTISHRDIEVAKLKTGRGNIKTEGTGG